MQGHREEPWPNLSASQPFFPEQRGIVAAGGFLFSHPEHEAGSGPRDAASPRAVGSGFGELAARAGEGQGWWEAPFVRKGAS